MCGPHGWVLKNLKLTFKGKLLWESSHLRGLELTILNFGSVERGTVNPFYSGQGRTELA